MVQSLLSQARRPIAIVIMGDHGPGSRLVWDHPESSDLRERFSTLVAIRLPEANQARLDDNITTVNVLRFVLSNCLAVSLRPSPRISTSLTTDALSFSSPE